MSKTILIDMDGVLRSGNKVLPGSKDFLRYIQENNFHCSIISNTTRYTSEAIINFFKDNEIDISKISVVTALDATIQYIKDNYTSAAVFCLPKAVRAFKEFHDPESNDAVVIGDMADQWDFEIMNTIFRKVQQGADLIAMQKNKYWKLPNGQLALDAGPFIAGIEYACGVEAKLLGKPSPLFFHTAINTCKGDQDNFIMVDDDLISDVKAAEDIGGKGILILTGKTNKEQLENSNYTPQHVVNKLEEVLVLL